MNTAVMNSRTRKLVAGTLATLTLGAAMLVTPVDSGAISVSANRVARGDSATMDEFKMTAETPEQDYSRYLHPRIGFTAE